MALPLAVEFFSHDKFWHTKSCMYFLSNSVELRNSWLMHGNLLIIFFFWNKYKLPDSAQNDRFQLVEFEIACNVCVCVGLICKQFRHLHNKRVWSCLIGRFVVILHGILHWKSHWIRVCYNIICICYDMSIFEA